MPIPHVLVGNRAVWTREARKPNVADLGVRLFYNPPGDDLSLLLEPRPLVRIVQVNRKSTLSYNNVNHKQL